MNSWANQILCYNNSFAFDVIIRKVHCPMLVDFVALVYMIIFGLPLFLLGVRRLIKGLR